eukprot:5887245-Pleurochrysis_carterae.AAC.4
MMYSAAASPRSPLRTLRALAPMIASALASACTRGSRTTRSASGTLALTASSPPKLEFVVTRGFS